MAVEITILSDLPATQLVQDLIEESLRAWDYTDRDIFAIKLAIEEALVNAIRHGNQSNPDKHISVSYTVTPQRFDIRITDEGDGFDHEHEFGPPDPTAPHVLLNHVGRGLLLMRGFMTAVQFHGAGNAVTMTRAREAAP